MTDRSSTDPARRLLGVAVFVMLLSPILCHAVFSLLPWTGSFAVVSGSMGAAAPAGSIAYVHDTGTYERGDVITFRRGDGYVTHRIVDETDAGYVTKGDANGAPDEWRVPTDDVVGELLVAVPLYGYLLWFASSTAGYLLLVLLPGLALLVLELRRLAAAVER